MDKEEPKYEITCPYCKKEMFCHRSIFHYMGVEDGGIGTCIYCNKTMKLIYHIDEDKMTTAKWDALNKEADKNDDM